MFAQPPRRPNVKVGSSVPVSEPFKRKSVRQFLPTRRRKRERQRVAVPAPEMLLRLIAGEQTVSSSSAADCEVKAKVTVKVTPENAKEWAHLDWAAADDKEVEKVFKTYDTLEKPMRLSDAQRQYPEATFGRCIGIHNVQHVQTDDPEGRTRVCYDGRPGEQRFGTGDTVEREVVFADRLERRRAPAPLAQAKAVQTWAAGRGHRCKQFDIEGAYLCTRFGKDEVHFVTLSPALEAAVLRVMGWERPEGGGRICFRLKGGLYGLVVAGEMWFEDISSHLAKIDWHILHGEEGVETLFVHRGQDFPSLGGRGRAYGGGEWPGCWIPDRHHPRRPERTQ